jgi:hypothetical protein
MISLFGKKKLTDEKVANIIVNTTLETVEKGWPEVAGFINDSAEFEYTPNLDASDYGRFLMIVIAGNFNILPKHFKDGHDKEVLVKCMGKFADVFDISAEQFARKTKDYRSFLSKVNSPSNNTLYSMSKGIFHKYELNQFQEGYFKSLNTPNPIFLKNLDEVMNYFLWDFEAFTDKYKVVSESPLRTQH